MGQKKKIQLLCDHTDEVLFEGWFYSVKEAVEQAISENVYLNGVNLEGANLACANMDDAQLSGANLKHVNFHGANLSESVFDHADFTGADVSHACLALSSLRNVNFTGTSFAATDVTDAVLSECRFSCQSVFTTLFGRAAQFDKCGFLHPEQGMFVMSKPPVVIQGLNRDIVYMDEVIKIGRHFVAKGDLIAAGYRHIELMYGREIANFLQPALCENIVNL